jgi:hypothetical protein
MIQERRAGQDFDFALFAGFRSAALARARHLLVRRLSTW